MRLRWTVVVFLVAAVSFTYLATQQLFPLEAQTRGTTGVAAVSGAIGTLDPTGPYEVVPGVTEYL